MSFYRNSVAPLLQSDPVVEWRRGRLIAAGCAPGLAARLAEDSEIDLHAVLELLDRGCPPEVAARILAPFDADRRSC
jgi:hypothetical protein